MLLDQYLTIVLAAGLGKRLAPLTRIVPKPCLPLLGQPLCMGMIDQLVAAGASRVHVNASYLSENLLAELGTALRERYPRDPHRIRFWTEPHRLETGGAILRIWRELCREDPSLAAQTKGVLVVSGDLVGDLPLGPMIDAWERQGACEDADALLVHHETPASWDHSVWVSGHGKGPVGRILGLGKAPPKGSTCGGGALHGADFANYQIISARALNSLTDEVRQVSSTDLIYRPLLKHGRKIAALELPAGSLWHNVGTPAEYASCLRNLLTRQGPDGEGAKTLRKEASARDLVADAVTPSGIRSIKLDKVTLQSLRVTPSLVSITEVETTSFAAAFDRFAGAFNLLSQGSDRMPRNEDAPLDGAGHPQLVISVPVASNSLLKARRPVLVGAGSFLELALSQRLSREAPEDWAALLFAPHTHP